LGAIKILQALPLSLMTSFNREMMVQKLFALIFHKSADIRLAVYEFFGSTLEFWQVSPLLDSVVGILLLALGDNDSKNVKSLVELINLMGGTLFNSISVSLGNIRDTVTTTKVELIRAYDQLCTAIAINKSELRGAIDAATLPARIDAFWDFFSEHVPDNQLARPEEYNFNKNFVHDPIWISLLCTKLSVPPPPFESDSGARREQVPTTPMGKRRFIIGFMQCLYPSSGSWNPMIRKYACIAIVLSCFKGFNVQGPILKALLENIGQLFLSSKYVTYQVYILI
jgi:hypothetical protein